VLASRGKQLTSEELAKFLGDHQDTNPTPLVFGVGPADGFSEIDPSISKKTARQHCDSVKNGSSLRH